MPQSSNLALQRKTLTGTISIPTHCKSMGDPLRTLMIIRSYHRLVCLRPVCMARLHRRCLHTSGPPWQALRMWLHASALPQAPAPLLALHGALQVLVVLAELHHGLELHNVGPVADLVGVLLEPLRIGHLEGFVGL